MSPNQTFKIHLIGNAESQPSLANDSALLTKHTEIVLNRNLSAYLLDPSGFVFDEIKLAKRFDGEKGIVGAKSDYFRAVIPASVEVESPSLPLPIFFPSAALFLQDIYKMDPTSVLPLEIVQEIFCHYLKDRKVPVQSFNFSNGPTDWETTQLGRNVFQDDGDIPSLVSASSSSNKDDEKAITTVPDDTSNEILAEILRRSGNLPLDVIIFFPMFHHVPTACTQFFSLLSTSSFRWTALNLAAPDALWEYRAVDAPEDPFLMLSLKRFESDCPDILKVITAPALNYLSLRRSSLCSELIEVDLLWWGNFGDAVDILSHIPALQSLSINFNFKASFFIMMKSTPSFLPQLQKLKLGGHCCEHTWDSNVVLDMVESRIADGVLQSVDIGPITIIRGSVSRPRLDALNAVPNVCIKFSDRFRFTILNGERAIIFRYRRHVYDFRKHEMSLKEFEEYL
ncbi:hypothetical protein EDD85DRAFT_940192 [Armillaria nabsnona]|nr:hypothetical protein EDD85DRAFT_940192 [Armillaria nabsnona]